MVVDCILDRKDGSPYNPREFYQDMLAYEADDISRAMDEGTEEDVKIALCDYIKFNDYNPAICDYINSVNWLTSSNRRTKMNKKSIKSAHQDKMWRGVPGVRMDWHGEWADPELEYNGMRANYWDVENSMYDWAKEDGIDAENDNEFNKYCQEHAHDVYEYIENYNANYNVNSSKGNCKSNRRPIQSMYVTQDISGNDLYTCLWSGGKDQFDSMIEDGADADDILNACEELLFREEGNPPTMTELNDLIWFEPDTIREYIGLSNPIESGCHGKSKKKDKKKAVKSGRKPVKSSRYNPYNGKGSFLVSIDIVEQGEHDTVSFSEKVLPLEEFISECKGYAESTNGYYTVTENGENQYKIEFGTSDDSFADEPGTDPYYEESCGVVVVELIYPFDEEMADYIENGGY